MKSESIENIVVDEAHDRTYVVMADRILTDGELYRAIRIELLRRGNLVARGERLIVSIPDRPNPEDRRKLRNTEGQKLK